MSQIMGGGLFGRALANEGIEKAFVLCGGHIMPILYGMRQGGIEITDVRHEASAMYAAIAYTRATGKPAVVVTTAGPGVINATPGMLEALELGVPILHIGGAVVVNGRDAGPLQDMSTLNVMEVCSKWARKLTSTPRIPEYVSLALRQATDLTPGPVYLEVPADLPLVKLEESQVKWPLMARTNAIPFGDPVLIDEAAEVLATAERPAAIIADGARFSIGDHAADIAALSDYLKMPVAVASSPCRGLFGDESKHPLLRTYGLLGADVVLAMGCRFDYRLGMGQGIRPDAKVIQVHTDMTQIGFNLRADVGIVGGTGPVASQLLAAVAGKRPEPAKASWMGGSLKSGPAALPDEYRAEGIPIHPARCAGEVAKFLAGDGKDWNLVVDGGEALVWMSLAVTATRPGQIYGGSAIGMIGTGPAHTIGAWVTNRKPVLWYTGDGSFGFYAMEMDTMARLGIPVVCVISNDSAWGMIKLEQRYTWEKEVEERGQCNTELHPMRAYEKMCAMWDGHGEVVTDPEEIVPAIKRAAANGKPSIINVEVDHESLSPFIAGVKQWRNVYYLQD
jgi:thiamine pyrophosphate-dependent acetolactate synthase large subunit-like protein